MSLVVHYADSVLVALCQVTLLQLQQQRQNFRKPVLALYKKTNTMEMHVLRDKTNK